MSPRRGRIDASGTRVSPRTFAHLVMASAAIAETRLLLAMHGDALTTAADTVRQIVAGTGPVDAFLSRLLGTFPVAWLATSTGTSLRASLCALTLVAVAARNAVSFELMFRWRRDLGFAARGALAIAAGFVLLQDGRYYNLWDAIDVAIHAVGAYLLVVRPSIAGFALLALVGATNRESAVYLGVACALCGLGTTSRTQAAGRVAAGGGISSAVLAITAFVRETRSTRPPGPYSNAWGNTTKLTQNAEVVGRVITAPGVYTVTSFALLAIVVGWIVALWSRTGPGGRRAFVLVAIMLAAHPLYSNLLEMRALVAIVPYLVFGALDAERATEEPAAV